MPDRSTFSLHGKVIVQFGGTGLLGRALVSSLASAGATLVVASRNRTVLSPLIATATADNHSVVAEEVDITSEKSLSTLRDRILAKHTKIDGVVFNAVSRPMRSMQDDLAGWHESMQTNATGLFATVRMFGDAMVANGSGSIVNIASMQGMIGPNFWLYEGTAMTAPPDYFFHKGGMINLTRYLAAHYGPHQIRVNSISPGGINNPEKPPATEFLQRYVKLTMLDRMAEAHEIGGAVVFLLSEASSYITGVNLPIDGGYTSK